MQGAVSSYLVPGPGVIRVEGYCFLECKDQVGEVAGSVGSGLVSLHTRDILSSWFLLSLRTGESWEGQSLPTQQGPKCQSIKSTENKNRFLIQVYLGEGGWLK